MFFACRQGRPTPSLVKESRRRSHRRLFLEQLERRELLSAVDLEGLFATPAVVYNPSQIRTSYGFNSLPFTPNYNAGAGAGQTIAIVNAYHNPNIVNNFITFNAQWGLPGNAHDWGNYLTIVNQDGQPAPLPRADASWGLETALDVQWAHAIAPAAKILLVAANSASYADLLKAVNRAVAMGANVVSLSWGGGEFSAVNNSTYSAYFNVPGVTFVAASGDNGAGTTFPAVSPYVVAVGGTVLTRDSSTGTWSETGWSGSGGGSSKYVSRPSYQTSFFHNSDLVSVSTSVFNKGKRLIPDVAYNASTNTGMYVYDQGWYQVGGTSAGTPQWAALIAIANQGRATPLSSTEVLTALYNPDIYAAIFRDIKSGNNGFAAGLGFDLVTGLGSPMADKVVAALIAFVSPRSEQPRDGGSGGATGDAGSGSPSAILVLTVLAAPDLTSLVTTIVVPSPVAPFLADNLPSGVTFNTLAPSSVPYTTFAPAKVPTAFPTSSGRLDRALAVMEQLNRPDDTITPMHVTPAPETPKERPTAPPVRSDGDQPSLPLQDGPGDSRPFDLDAQAAAVPVRFISCQTLGAAEAAVDRSAVAAALVIFLSGYGADRPWRRDEEDAWWRPR